MELEWGCPANETSPDHRLEEKDRNGLKYGNLAVI